MPRSKIAPEKYYSVQQVAELLHCSDTTVRRMFQDEPGVISLSKPPKSVNNRKHRPHVSLRIPGSALMRVLDRQAVTPKTASAPGPMVGPTMPPAQVPQSPGAEGKPMEYRPRRRAALLERIG